MLAQSLSYHSDSTGLFARIAHEDWALFLDSGQPMGKYGRYDIICGRPFITVVTQQGVTTVSRNGQQKQFEEEPFSVLKSILSAYPQQEDGQPFAGGAVGYFGYDLGRYLEKLPDIALDAENIPDMCVGIYDWAVIVDHREQQASLVSFGLDPATEANWSELCELFAEGPSPLEDDDGFHVVSSIASNMDQAAYAGKFDRVKSYITEGDCYQVNLAQRFSARAAGDGWLAYRHLRQISPAPFMAYMRFPYCQVLSASPERFLQVSGRHVETRPIKGTRPRATDAAEDRHNAEELGTSLKDRAENLMIVDLLRNDISKNCEVGSVRADRLFALESFANVHHLVSTVTGTLADNKTAVDLLRGCFPGGSITGAPKLRAMQIIEELEPHRRGLYCGAIGYIGFDGNMDTNIAIRTAVYSHGEIRFWAGGGIVADSEMQKEYRETWDKASSMLQLMQYFADKTTRQES
ncbi:MAG: aminodeoxychorismate synthase, component I [Betaproteobacteria bacterium HGW-Betaproteobacteria-1]|jgi:para-aminobenzoate synthetase component 1|nr:MAG: aminodeoxychorismate synthase, component I [Betaproteobacteria bacterium HGW-Betaproteobacteria-1]